MPWNSRFITAWGDHMVLQQELRFALGPTFTDACKHVVSSQLFLGSSRNAGGALRDEPKNGCVGDQQTWCDWTFEEKKFDICYSEGI